MYITSMHIVCIGMQIYKVQFLHKNEMYKPTAQKEEKERLQVLLGEHLKLQE